MSKTIYVRLGLQDVVLTEKELEKFNGHVDLIDEDGNVIASSVTYLIGHEDEDGNECDEDGNLY